MEDIFPMYKDYSERNIFAQVEIEAIRGASFRGDIGLDDISFTDGPCSKSPL